MVHTLRSSERSPLLSALTSGGHPLESSLRFQPIRVDVGCQLVEQINNQLSHGAGVLLRVIAPLLPGLHRGEWVGNEVMGSHVNEPRLRKVPRKLVNPPCVRMADLVSSKRQGLLCDGTSPLAIPQCPRCVLPPFLCDRVVIVLRDQVLTSRCWKSSPGVRNRSSFDLKVQQVEGQPHHVQQSLTFLFLLRTPSALFLHESRESALSFRQRDRHSYRSNGANGLHPSRRRRTGAPGVERHHAPKYAHGAEARSQPIQSTRLAHSPPCETPDSVQGRMVRPCLLSGKPELGCQFARET